MIQVNHDVRPDSMLVLNAIREVVEESGFDDVLENVCDRVSEIESLLRTRELTVSAGWHCNLYDIIDALYHSSRT